MADQAAAVDPGFGDPDRRDDIVLNGRYKIVVSAPLKALDTPTARAFRAEDIDGGGVGAVGAPGLFARVNESGLPSRDWEIDALRELRHPHLMHLIDIGATEFGGPGKAALTVVLEYPQGGRLMAPEGAGPMPLREVTQRVMAPLCGVLEALHERNVFHRAIHPDNLFVGRKPGQEVILGDCVSSAAGHNLPPAFQPLERASAAPLGCGPGDRAADIFSFGATLAALLAGRIPGAGVEPDALLDARLERGSLAALCGPFRFPREIDRLLAGMLADDPDHRWTLANIRQWLSDQPVSTAAARRLNKSKRAFSFAEREFYNPIAIAVAFNRNWSEAVAEIQSGRLEKWLATGINHQAAAETVIGLRQSNASGVNTVTSDALVSRVCMVLDPKGPIRFKGMAVSIDAIGVLLAYAFIEGHQDTADNIATILGQGLPAAWISAFSDRRKDMASDLSNFIRLRQYISHPKLGHGLERCLYEMNRSLRCLHPMIEPAMSGGVAALLASLDELISPGGGEPPWTDRHVIAYLAAQMHPKSDGLLASLAMPGRPQALDTMIGVALVAQAQETLDVPPLPRLMRMAGSRFFKIIESYQSETRRKALRYALERQLNKGDFSALLKLLNDTELQEQDRCEYDDAKRRYQCITGEIVSLEGEFAGRRDKAARVGRRSAAWAAFFGLLTVSLVTLMGLAL